MDEIINRCKAGDILAQGILYENYINQVLKTAFLLCRNKDLAEDIAQETFIRVFSKINTFEDKGTNYTFVSWLYSVTLNVAKNIFRKQKILNFFSSINDYEDIKSSVLLEADYEKAEREKLLFKTINNLPYKFKEIIILKYYNDFSQQEIASILEIPLGTVKSRLNSALKKIRKNIGEDITLVEVINHD